MNDSEKLAIAVEALRDINDPVGRDRLAAKEKGEPFDERAAAIRAMSPLRYHELARTALIDIGVLKRR